MSEQPVIEIPSRRFWALLWMGALEIDSFTGADTFMGAALDKAKMQLLSEGYLEAEPGLVWVGRPPGVRLAPAGRTLLDDLRPTAVSTPVGVLLGRTPPAFRASLVLGLFADGVFETDAAKFLDFVDGESTLAVTARGMEFIGATMAEAGDDVLEAFVNDAIWWSQPRTKECLRLLSFFLPRAKIDATRERLREMSHAKGRADCYDELTTGGAK